MNTYVHTRIIYAIVTVKIQNNLYIWYLPVKHWIICNWNVHINQVMNYNVGVGIETDNYCSIVLYSFLGNPLISYSIDWIKIWILMHTVTKEMNYNCHNVSLDISDLFLTLQALSREVIRIGARNESAYSYVLASSLATYE